MQDEGISAPPFLGQRRPYTHAERLLWVKSQGISPGHNESCSSEKPSLQDPSWLGAGVVLTQGGSPARSSVETETSNWLKEGNDQEDLTDLNDWAASSLRSSSPGVAHVLPLWVRGSAPLQSQLQDLRLRVLSHLLSC